MYAHSGHRGGIFGPLGFYFWSHNDPRFKVQWFLIKQVVLSRQAHNSVAHSLHPAHQLVDGLPCRFLPFNACLHFFRKSLDRLG